MEPRTATSTFTAQLLSSAKTGVQGMQARLKLTQQYSFLPRTIRDWNDRPQEVIEAKTIDTFVSRASRLQ